MKEEREKEAARLAEQQSLTSNPLREAPNTRNTKNVKSKDERRRVAQLQELENTITELESQLANLGTQLESPLVRPEEVSQIGNRIHPRAKRDGCEAERVGENAGVAFIIIVKELQ